MKKIIRRVLIVTAVMLLTMMNMEKNTVNAEAGYAYILADAETGAVIEHHDADVRMNPGYLAKLMSLLLIAEDIETGKYNLTDEMTASQTVSGTKGAVIWLEPGDTLTVDELLKGVVIGNANDAIIVLAEHSERSIENFVKRMNGRAFELGLRDSAFYSPDGYSDEKSYTTARDMSVICSELSKYTFMEDYFRTWRDFIKDDSVELVNENTLARTFDKHCGYKASHSEKSGYCIAEGGKSQDGSGYIAVILGAPDEETSFSEAKRLIKKGFSDYKHTVPGFLDELLMPVRVKNGVDSAVEICLESQETIVVPRSAGELSNVILVPEYMEAPLRKGQKIGTAGFYSGDTLVYETAIVVKDDVERLSFMYVFKKMLLNLIVN